MPAMFPIERDDEFYVFLKSSLPSTFRIEAEPAASYDSEWMFNYKLYNGDVLLKTYKGDYRVLEKGALICEAKKILSNLEIGNNQC
jgi:hypothetical protein